MTGPLPTSVLTARLARGLRSERSIVRAAWRLLAVAAAAAVGFLVLLHVWVFWEQLTSGRLSDLAVAARWGGALLLCSAFALLRRAGVPLLWGRKAFIVWLLVVLLHGWNGGTAVDTAGGPAGAAEDAAVFLLPAAAPLFGLALCLLIVIAVRQSSALRLLGSARCEATRLPASVFTDPSLVPRAPPVSAL